MLVKVLLLVEVLVQVLRCCHLVQKDGDGGGDTIVTVSQHNIIAIMLDDGDDGAKMVGVWYVVVAWQRGIRGDEISSVITIKDDGNTLLVVVDGRGSVLFRWVYEDDDEKE